MSSLKIYYSDKIEDLAEELKKHLLEDRAEKGNPFVFSQVVVPNTNIAKWLQIREFAAEPSLCMGVEFPFIEQCLFKTLGNCLKPNERPQLLPMNAYANGIISILLKDNDARLAPFRRYVADGEGGPLVIDSRSRARMAWQLAVKLADLMDKYEVHRQKIIEKWLDKDRAAEISDPTELAEAALAQKLFWDDGIYPPTGNAVSLRQLFERVKGACEKPNGAGRKMHFFGLSTLSSLQVEIIRWLAQVHDIEIYHNNVCLEYWGDIETKKERAKRLRELKSADDDVDMESPLLQNWGRAGRETLRLFVDLEEANGNSSDPIAFEWSELPSAGDDGKTMLAKVQASVRHCVSEVGRVERQDASIQVVGAPGIRREVEMVYNAILGAVWKPDGSGERPWSDCTFSDIAVLVPDMKKYRPVIEAVFDARGQIPYGLIDTSASEYSHYLEGFMALMSIAREGMSRETVFAVLDNSCVQRALGFTPKDVREWRRYTEEIGAFDGFEGKENYKNVSWDRALSRLRLGMVAKDRSETKDRSEAKDRSKAEDKPKLTVWEGGEDSALKFSEIVETLYRELSPLATKKLVCTAQAVNGSKRENWADTLRRIAGDFLANDRDDMLEATVCRQLFQTLYAIDSVEGVQGLDFVVAAVEEFVGGIKCQKGGYLTHGVTIAGLQPMRPVPFKQVFVLGMGEGMFPGRDSETTLEIRGATRTLGDMGVTTMNRHLFLETLMATRERLVISYPNLDIVKDAELFPSGMVCELEEFLEKSVLPEQEADGGTKVNAKFREVQLPLLERGEEDDLSSDKQDDNILEDPVSPIRWGKEYYAGLIPTYSNVERGIAWRIKNTPSVTESEGQSTSKTEGESAPKTERITLTAKELAEFLESPLRTALRRQHGIAVEGYRDEALDPESPLEMETGPTTWDFQKAVLKAVPKDPAATDIKRVFDEFAERGRLPESCGMLGDYSLKKEEDALKGNPARSESLGAISTFAKEFFPQNGKRPDSVRTLLRQEQEAGKFFERIGSNEILYTGQTSDWIVSEDGRASYALVFKPCGDKRKENGEIEMSEFPPKAVLEPFVTWLIMVLGLPESTYSLRVGIADMGQVLYNGWNWSVTPKDAKAYIEDLTTAYLKFLDAPDDDGRYLDYGYSKMAKALSEAITKKKTGGGLPSNDEGWKNVIDEFSSDDFWGSDKNFNNNLVIERVVELLSRMPENKEDDDGGDDLKIVKDRFEKRFKKPMSGTRAAAQKKEA